MIISRKKTYFGSKGHIRTKIGFDAITIIALKTYDVRCEGHK